MPELIGHGEKALVLKVYLVFASGKDKDCYVFLSLFDVNESVLQL